MYWYSFWSIAVALLGLAVIDAIAVLFFRYKRKRILTPNRALILGTWASASVMFYPLYLRELEGTVGVAEYIRAGLVSIQHSIRLFAFDGDYMDIVDMAEGLEPEIQTLYTLLGAILYLAAPILTVGLILSFFKNLTSYVHYVFSFWKHTHVFSELNEKSLALAKSIDDANNKKVTRGKKKYRFLKKALIVFTDVTLKDDEENLELLEEAKELGAILFTKDLESIRYRNRHLSIRKVNFYLISDDEEEKIRHAESIMRDYDISEKIELRLFSDDIRSELLLAAKDVKTMKVIRVNDIQSLVYHTLDNHGLRLFENAREINHSEKMISAVIVGLGKYGLEMLKALIWFCQMPGYRIKINAFDVDEHTEEKLVTMCPELMSAEFNGQDIPGEARYEIKIHSGIDTNSPAFFEKLSEIKDATYIFVGLGEDEVNLSTAVKIRTACEKIHYTDDHHKPDVETVVYDSNIRNHMGVKWGEERHKLDEHNEYVDGVTNFKNQCYNIHIIGDLDHFYSVETLMNFKLENIAKAAHCLHYPESTFWKYEYNYRSSLARALHTKFRRIMLMDTAEVEHKRWNAYMRTEGYQYSGSTQHISRNDLGKLHHDLVPFVVLDDDEKKKDESKGDVK